MPAAAVLALLARLEAVGVDCVVDGGWGVDALIGVQTREHDDLDVVVAAGDLDAVRALLQADGFALERDLLPTAVAFRHPDGRAVDLHLVHPTADGGGGQLLGDGTRWHYGPPATGAIGGSTVACCSVETQVAAHLGYLPDDDDRRDMARLAAAFGVTLPPPYADRGPQIE